MVWTCMPAAPKSHGSQHGKGFLSLLKGLKPALNRPLKSIKKALNSIKKGLTVVFKGLKHSLKETLKQP